MDALVRRARRVIDDSLYVVLSTADADGNPLATPLFYAADGYRALYWASSPDVERSQNLTRRSQVAMVIFDSTAPVGRGAPHAVYLRGRARELDEAELAHGLAVFPGDPSRGGRQLSVAEVRAPGPYRLYRAEITAASVQCRLGDDPCERHGLPYAHRVDVSLG